MAYFSIDPFGEERSDLRAGIVASTIANANRDSKQRRRPYTPQDFMPDFESREESGEKSPEEVYALMRSWAMMNREEGN
jgi:hypothetical protein